MQIHLSANSARKLKIKAIHISKETLLTVLNLAFSVWQFLRDSGTDKNKLDFIVEHLAGEF